MSCDYEVIMSLPLEAEYPVEPFEWSLPSLPMKFLASPWIMNRDFQADNLADFE